MAMLSPWTVGVIGSGTIEHEEYARAVGELVADLSLNLLTGGGGGVMTAVSRAYTQRQRSRGICIGIIPCATEKQRSTPKAGYPNEFVELAIYTHLPYSGRQGMHDLSRNHINVLSSAAIVALPGEDGTIAEISLALQYARPVIAYSPDAALVKDFPGSVRRAAAIHDVAAFIQRFVA
jgi:uncharacterized protein (TIGR00725 family)